MFGFNLNSSSKPPILVVIIGFLNDIASTATNEIESYLIEGITTTSQSL